MLTWELLGAVVGAGLASGREIASFFGRYGAWGYAGIVLSAAVMALLAGARLPEKWRGRWPERLWRASQTLLLLITGGAMLAGAGTLAAQLTPGRPAELTAMAGTLLLAWVLARRTAWGLAWVSGLLMAGMTVMMAVALVSPAADAAMATEAVWPGGALRAVAYGGFNAAILHPVMAARQGSGRQLTLACCMLAGLLSAGLAAILAHPSSMGASMPFAQIAGAAGWPGTLLTAACLYLGILSTLTACLRSLPGTWSPAGVVLAAMLGFTGAVEAAYPALGALCGLLLAAMCASNFAKSSGRTFHSGSGMI